MTCHITVLGVVQGVGYRPFVARIAERLGVRGTVKNSGGIVEIDAEGEPERIRQFAHELAHSAPRGAQVSRVVTEEIEPRAFDDFAIIESELQSDETPLFPPDLPICEDCLRELYAADDRRYGYPFISCVACGPRYSILERLPYDRCNITMDAFPMCPACEAEYTTETRRRHAQTISCHDCGPQLIFQSESTRLDGAAALEEGVRLLREGAVLAIKGIGGYQLACDPRSERAVDTLRRLKRRDKKPFAVMFPSLDAVRAVCRVTEEEQALLSSPARPIVLLPKLSEPFCRDVSDESRFLGAFLPYTGLHQLLTDACGALVMTSGNLTNEPIITDDASALALPSDCVGGVLYHTRAIVAPLDDSVARVVCGVPQLIRRSRGYVPAPIFLTQEASVPVLAMGGDLKACFCLMRGNRAYLSQHFGDMEEYAVFETYRAQLSRMEGIFGLAPRAVACDMHPGYHTVQLARSLGLPLTEVQHHHAHAASVMAEHGLHSCIGVSFDGTGFGTDGAAWGGEFLLCHGADFTRAAHLRYVSLCGGDRVSKDASLTALCYRLACGEESDDERAGWVAAALRAGVNTCESSSMGRLFDAVSAALGIRMQNTYEGECAIALENAAAAAQAVGEAPYPLTLAAQDTAEGLLLDQIGLLRDVMRAAREGASVGAVALGFHLALARAVLAVCATLRARSGERAVALSGGVFGNLLLMEQCVRLLEADGFEVYFNRETPCNDGGICLGQAWLCAQRVAQ
ncbi:MAG: carbamoyltransferase HypF [Clostridium sp. SCN 57-10]|nr:MAG: carbamoyltransferase HypF [Clostridium sp. SCN 57-10]